MNTLKTFALAALLAAALPAVAEGEIRAGANLDIDQPVADDLLAAGANVVVSAPVAGKARITGGHVEITSSGSVAKDARIAGGDIVVKGSIDGDLRASGGHVSLDSAVGGDVTVNAGALLLGPNARIGGALRFRGEDLQRDAGAVVTGGVTHTAGRHRAWQHGRFGGFMMGVLFTAGLVVLAALMAGALPGTSLRMQQELRSHPWLAPLLGFVALVCIPIAAVLAFVTVIGIPLGLLALLAYLALLLVGFVTTSVVLGGLALESFKSGAGAVPGWRIGAAVLAMLLIASLARVPVLGGFVALAALVVGMGVIVGAILHRSEGGTPTAA